MPRPVITIFDKRLAAKLRMEREARGLSLGDVGRILSVTKVAVHYIEKNKCRMTAREVFTLSVFFRWDLNKMKKLLK